MRPAVRRMRYTCEAYLALLAIGLVLRLVRSDRLIAAITRPPAQRKRFAGEDIPRVALALEAAAGWPLGGADSLVRALAAQWMLRRRGICGRLGLGAELRDGQVALQAWTTAAGQVVTGAEHLPHVQSLGEFGAGSAEASA